MIRLIIRLIALASYVYCLMQDFADKAVGWFLADMFIFPLGIIRGFLKAFGVI